MSAKSRPVGFGGGHGYTDTEAYVLSLLRRGMSDKEIIERMNNLGLTEKQTLALIKRMKKED